MKPYVILKDINSSNKINTLEDWGLILSSKEIQRATPKTNYIDIPGGDGSLDLTEATGEVKYKDRKITLTFTMTDKIIDREYKLNKIANTISGRKFKITMWDDLDYYYVGRISINSFKTKQSVGTLTLECTCEPYKYKTNISCYSYEINGLKTIVVTNERKRVVPTLTLSKPMEIVFNNSTYALDDGTHQILNIYFDSGKYFLTVNGAGTFTIEYQEASL